MFFPTIKKAYFEITNVCNLNCSFCPGTKRKKSFVDLDDFQRTAEKLKGKITYLYLHLMGEPTLHPKLAEMLSIADEMGFKVIVTTNGTTLPEKGRILLDNGRVHKVSISLHSFEANENEKINMDDYLDGCFSFARKAAEKGIITVLRLWNLDGNNTVGQNLLNKDILYRMEQNFDKIGWSETRSGIRLCDKVFLEYAQKFEWPDNEKILINDKNEDFFCHGLRDQIGILCDGTVVPCCLDSEGIIALGNIFESSYEEIMGAKKVKDFYDLVSARKCPSKLCVTCEYAKRFTSKRGKK